MNSIKKHIPNLFTFGNLFCGIIAILYAIQGNFEMTFVWISAGIIFDFFDGFIARALNVSSSLGVQLDSLADMVTSGVVPGIVMFKMIENSENLVKIFNADFLPYLGFLITLASAYRLAKFNIDTEQTSSFVGLPTPANALFITSLAVILNHGNYVFVNNLLTNIWILILVTFTSCYLLNSKIRLFALKFKTLSVKDNLQKYIFLLISIFLVIFLQISSVPIIIMAYILLSILWKENHNKINSI